MSTDQTHGQRQSGSTDLVRGLTLLLQITAVESISVNKLDKRTPVTWCMLSMYHCQTEKSDTGLRVPVNNALSIRKPKNPWLFIAEPTLPKNRHERVYCTICEPAPTPNRISLEQSKSHSWCAETRVVSLRHYIPPFPWENRTQPWEKHCWY